jgi:hypothetical protein
MVTLTGLNGKGPKLPGQADKDIDAGDLLNGNCPLGGKQARILHPVVKKKY